MTPPELKAECELSIEQGHDGVILKMPSSARRRGLDRIRLAGRSGPIGVVVGSTVAGVLIVRFKASEILAWLARCGA